MVDLSYLKGNVFPGESGGDYDALFGYSQRPGRQFAGVKLTDMTVDQALQFAAPSGPYGQWVKGQVGRVATPMGAYQVVGSTLRAAKEGLGLTGNERMTPELQDQIGQWIYQTQGPGAWEAWGKGGSTGDTGMVRGGAGQTSMMGQSGADFLASEQERPRGLLGGFFGPEGRDRRSRLAIALEGMTLNPNQALIGELQRGIEQRETAAQKNATVEFLRSRGRGDLADAIQGGLPAADALRIAMTPAEAPTPQSAIAKLEADRRAGLITDEQYQAGLQALAPSGMTIESDGAGGFRLVQGPGAGKPLTEAQSKDTVYATRAAGALPTLDKYETALTSIGDVALGADPTGLLRGRMQSEEYQLARQAGDEFLQAILRKDTGAAITAQEQELYGQTYLPQPGDSQEVIAQKRQARRRALAAIKAGLPSSAIVAQERALQESGGADQGEGPARVTNDAEYDALPSGTQFIGPDGKLRRKP